jgi:hypothetical protein
MESWVRAVEDEEGAEEGACEAEAEAESAIGGDTPMQPSQQLHNNSRGTRTAHERSGAAINILKWAAATPRPDHNRRVPQSGAN